jgi:2'-5' RNA ligase
MRLFVGVELDEHVKDAAAAIGESLRRELGHRIEARWIAAANLHITLWFLGEVNESRAKSTLEALLTSRLESIGYEAERRAYSAHLTIARVKSVSRGVSARDIRSMLQGRSDHAGRCRIGAVTIFRSHLSPKGATYEPVQRVRLR